MRSATLVAALLVSLAEAAGAQPSPDAPLPAPDPAADPGQPQPVPPQPVPPPQHEPLPAPRLRPTPLQAQPAVSPAQIGRDRRLVGLEIGGAGVLALAVGVIAGLDARSKRDDARALGCTDDLSLCPMGEALDRAEDAYQRGRFATGFFIGGAVAIGAGAVLWFTAPRATSRQWQASPSLGRSGTGLVLSRAF